MELQSFNSIFELFATFFLAYVLIDELTENPFISLMSEKILRKYRAIDQIYREIKSNISGHRTSLTNLAQMSQVRGHAEYVNEIAGIEAIMKSTTERNEQSFAEIRSSIRQNYITRCFVYLNAYLFFYCFTILFFSGLYSSVETEKTWTDDHNVRLDNSLALFLALSFIYLLVGWILDKKRPVDKVVTKEKGILDWDRINGYLVASILFIIFLILSGCSFYFNWHIIHFETYPYHNILVLVSIILPVSNFLIYIIKAFKRADSSMPNLLAKARTYKNDYLEELREVDLFVYKCGKLVMPKVVPAAPELFNNNSPNP
jgi:hypothetical protein